MGYHESKPTRRTGEEHQSAVLEHDRSANLELLARRYSRALTSFFQRRVSNQDDVPDLVQDVFLRLSRLQAFPELRHPQSYLFQTASCALRDRLRRDAVRERSAHLVFDEALHGSSPLTPERIVGGQLAVHELRDAVARLPERSRDIFVLRMFEGMSCADIAVAMGISRRAVEKHYARALASVTANLKAHRNV